MVLKEVTFSGGFPGASSTNRAEFHAKYAFSGEPNRFWHSKYVGKDGVIVCYDFQRRTIRPTSLSFQPRNRDFEAAKRQMPTRFQMVGTNDAACQHDSPWTILCEGISYETIETMNDHRGCAVDTRESCCSVAYSCVGLRVLTMKGDKVATLSRVKIWTKF